MLTTQLTDRDLVLHFQEGEEVAFEELYRRHYRYVTQIAYGVLRNNEDAEETAQDVFLRVHKSLPRFRGDSKFSTWIYQIAINRARSKCKVEKSKPTNNALDLEDAFFESLIPDDHLSPEEKILLDESETRLSEGMETLPELYRNALVLRSVEQVSYEKLASHFNCNLGTLKSRIARAREELRKRLDLKLVRGRVVL